MGWILHEGYQESYMVWVDENQKAPTVDKTNIDYCLKRLDKIQQMLLSNEAGEKEQE